MKSIQIVVATTVVIMAFNNLSSGSTGKTGSGTTEGGQETTVANGGNASHAGESRGTKPSDSYSDGSAPVSGSSGSGLGGTTDSGTGTTGGVSETGAGGATGADCADDKSSTRRGGSTSNGTQKGTEKDDGATMGTGGAGSGK